MEISTGEANGDELGTIDGFNRGTTLGPSVATGIEVGTVRYFVQRTYPPKAIVATNNKINDITSNGEFFLVGEFVISGTCGDGGVDISWAGAGVELTGMFCGIDGKVFGTELMGGVVDISRGLFSTCDTGTFGSIL